MKKTLFLDTRSPSYTIDDPIQTVEGQDLELGDWIARGGNGAVYTCVDSVSGEELAVKFLLQPGTKMGLRFERETALLRDLDNLHIVRYRGSGTVASTFETRKGPRTTPLPFIVMELAERNLSQLMVERKTAFPYEDYAAQFRGLSGALAALHEKAIHRDIKPENILISGDRWLLSDYGLCTAVDPELPDLTGDEEKIGPKFWLSPEAQNKMLKCQDQITRASDVFQLASIFWYAATGRHPLGVVTEHDWTGPQKLFAVLHASLMHDITRRPQTGKEFLEAIETSLEA